MSTPPSSCVSAPIEVTTEGVMKLLPHRYPMLLIDRLHVTHPGQSAIGIKNVTANEPFFPGHFPNSPVMPGVLIIEAMAQTAGALVMHSMNLDQDNHLVYFMSIQDARFRKVVRPGDTLELHVDKRHGRGQVWRFFGQALVRGEIMAEATYTAMIRPL